MGFSEASLTELQILCISDLITDSCLFTQFLIIPQFLLKPLTSLFTTHLLCAAKNLAYFLHIHHIISMNQVFQYYILLKSNIKAFG